MLEFVGIYITSPQGIFAAMSVAAPVGAFAIEQVLYASQARPFGMQKTTTGSIRILRSNQNT